MISLSHVSKSYDGTLVLNDVNLEFPERGLVMIYGPSGSGKSTLLHIISLLLSAKGDVLYDGKSFKGKSDEEISEFRLRNIGLAFQDFKLFESDTVLNNVLLPLSTIDSEKKEENEQEALTCLSLCGIRHLSKSVVSTLSGGERQRVAIARAMVNKARYIFADEPTGSLDRDNTLNVMSLLQNISLSRLVVVVSHDKTLIDQFADRVIYLEDGKVIDDVTINHEQKQIEYVQTAKNSADKKPSLPTSFIFKHIRKIDKSKKWRSRFSKGVISLGLIGVGLSFIISDAVSGIVVDSYSQLIDKDQIIVDSGSYTNTFESKEALSLYGCLDIKNEYPDLIYDIGVTYLFDEEEFYPEENRIYYCPSQGVEDPLPGLDISLINDFIWLDTYPPAEVLPEMPTSLDNFQVVAQFTMNTARMLCQDIGLGDNKTEAQTLLSNYLENNQIILRLRLQNDSWNYWDTYDIEVVGFTIGTSNCFYHYNHLWNQDVFSYLSYDFSPNIESAHDTPWTMEEIYYFECLDDAEMVYSLSLQDSVFSNAFLDKGSEAYFSSYANNIDAYSTRLLAFSDNYSYLSPYLGKSLVNMDSNLTSVVYGTDMGYALYGSYFMSGFAREMYFSFNKNRLDDVDNYLSYYDASGGVDYQTDKSVLKGHYTQVANSGVTFYPLEGEDFYMGRAPSNIKEVAVSTAFLDAVGWDYSKALNDETLFVLYDKEDNYLSNNYVSKIYVEDELDVVGIIDSDKIAIYQDSDWLISYFIFTYDVSAFNLVPYSFAFNINDPSKMDETMKKLKQYLPGYTVYNPVNELNSSVREVSNYISIGILIISIVALVASSLLIFAMINLLIIENKRDFGLLRCIGVNSKQSFKMVLGYGLYLCITSFILSVIELVFVMLILVLTTSSFTFGASFFIALLCMAAVSLLVSLFACALQYKKITRLDPLEAIKR
ncbi:MAG: ATP-binding cassette domain-containing protein [Coprobacillus sp.]|nr:ATP-binding cassette domain-containing protein [Coprobacillus sp.]